MSTDIAITVAKDGPYLVAGNVPLAITSIHTDADGESVSWDAGATIPGGERYALCRCGYSESKPFCDGSHKREGFDGTETASHAPYAEQATAIEGPGLTLHDAQALCAFARFCDVGDSVWDDIARADDAAARERVIAESMRCPSGRLVVSDPATGEAFEPTFAPSIELIEDPAKGASGPIFVRGGIPVTGADGTTYEIRNRVTLCRCGQSGNKPFCDGSHAEPAWQDGLTSATGASA